MATIEDILIAQSNRGYKFIPNNLLVIENSDPILKKIKSPFFIGLMKKNFDCSIKELKFYDYLKKKVLYGNRDSVQMLIDAIRRDMLPIHVKSLFKTCLMHVAKNLDQYESRLNQLPVELREAVRNEKLALKSINIAS